jgi:hypothetical protein
MQNQNPITSIPEGASIVAVGTVANFPLSIRAGGFPAHGFPMFFMPGHAPNANALLEKPCTARSTG